MKTQESETIETTVAATVAGEDLKGGDYVALFSQVHEFPSYMWTCGDYSLSPQELVKLRYVPSTAGQPLKVVGICLPFVYAKQPCGEVETIDLRRTEIVRLDKACAKSVWKLLEKRTPGTAV